MRIAKSYYYFFGLLGLILIGTILGYYLFFLRPQAELDQVFGPDRLNSSYRIGLESSQVRVCSQNKKFRFKGDFKESVSIASAQNEYNSFQLVLLSKYQALEAVTLSFSNLRHRTSRAKIDAFNYHSYRAGYVKVPKTKTHKWFRQIQTRLKFHFKNPVDSLSHGVTADPLIPQNIFTVSPGQEQPIFISLYVPGNAAAGDYEGQIQIQPKDAPQRTVRVKLRVWNFSLPQKGRFTAIGTLDLNNIREFYGPLYTPELQQNWLRFFLRYRLNPISLYHEGIWPPRNDLAMALKHGLSMIILGGWHKIKTLPEKQLAQYCRQLKELKSIDKAAIYLTDEPTPAEINAVRHKARQVRKICPELQIMGGVCPRKDLFSFIDIWDAMVASMTDNYYVQALARERQKQGEKVFWYVAIHPPSPYPNLQIEFPLIDARLLFWLAWKYQLDGFEYYYLNQWGQNLLKRKTDWYKYPVDSPKAWDPITFRDQKFSYAGDGQLVYPGENGSPWPSIRLENIRDGLEDHEMLNLLDQILQKYRSINPDSPLVAEGLRLLTLAPIFQREIPQPRLSADIGVDRTIADWLKYRTRDPKSVETLRFKIGNFINRLLRPPAANSLQPNSP